MAATIARSCSVIKVISRLPTLAEVRCLHRTVAVVKPLLQPSVITSNDNTTGYVIPMSVTRELHTANTLLKKFSEELYERYRVYSPEGQYLCTTELYIVTKLCARMKRYTYEEMVQAPVSDKDGNLKAIQLVDKKPPVLGNKAKTIQFKKDISGDSKMPQIMEILIDMGQINLHFLKPRCQAEPEVKKAVSKFAEISRLDGDGETTGKLYKATLKPVDTELLVNLMEIFQKEHAEHVKSVQDMMNVVNKK